MSDHSVLGCIGHASTGRMVMTHAGVPRDSPGATGWAMALDKLAAYIETSTIE